MDDFLAEATPEMKPDLIRREQAGGRLVAPRGVQYRPAAAVALLRRNLLIYGLGGLILPFVGIQTIGLCLVALNLA